jgi:hypothetical protein
MAILALQQAGLPSADTSSSQAARSYTTDQASPIEAASPEELRNERLPPSDYETDSEGDFKSVTKSLYLRNVIENGRRVCTYRSFSFKSFFNAKVHRSSTCLKMVRICTPPTTSRSKSEKSLSTNACCFSPSRFMQAEFTCAGLTYVFCSGNLFFAPIDQRPKSIIDLGTGTGDWAVDGMSDDRSGRQARFLTPGHTKQVKLI